MRMKQFSQSAKRLEYYRRAHHRKGLPRPCLTVGKDTGIVALEGTFYYVRTEIVEHLKGRRKTINAAPLRYSFIATGEKCLSSLLARAQ